jgi:hypothetical protein
MKKLSDYVIPVKHAIFSLPTYVISHYYIKNIIFNIFKLNYKKN